MHSSTLTKWGKAFLYWTVLVGYVTALFLRFCLSMLIMFIAADGVFTLITGKTAFPGANGPYPGYVAMAIVSAWIGWKTFRHLQARSKRRNMIL